MIKRIFVTSFLAGVMLSANAQDWKRTQNWYFGDKAGLSFATDPPTVLTDGAMNAGEGCATISDENGNLLFYTNGLTVWNRKHEVMLNGTFLNGHYSFTQSVLIVPWPDNDSLFFVFTTDALGMENGLQYSLVNIYGGNNYGEVILKNIKLQGKVSEKLAATKHHNGRDYWLIAKGFGNNEFYSYLLNRNGLLDCPIVSNVASNSFSISDSQGEIKFSDDGTVMVDAVYNLAYNRIDLFDFDKSKGILDNKLNISNVILPYSVEFSANQKMLYVSTRLNFVYQFDLSSNDETEIKNSQYLLYSPNNTNLNYHGKMQRGLNNKIYISLMDSIFVSEISKPNLTGVSSGFILAGLYINSKNTFSIPNFVSSYFYRPSLDFKYKTTCDDHTVYFEGQFSDSNASPRWSIFQGSNLIHTTQHKAYSYQFTDTGEYLVRLVASGDTVDKNISIEPNLLAYADTIVCNASEIELNIPSNFRCINWQDGSGASRYTINQSGTYYVSAYNQKGCLVLDTIQVRFGGVPKPNIRRSGDSLHTDSAAHSYIWHLNNAPLANTIASIRVTEQGTYKVETRDTLGCAAVSEPFQVEVLSIHTKEKPTFNIYPNPSLLGSEIQIESESLIHSIKITDLTGRTVYQKKDLNQNQLTLKLSKRGVYIFTINGSNHCRTLIE